MSEPLTMDEKIKRINELYHKSQAEGLSAEEKDEQARLRKEYINSVKANLRSQLNNINIQNEDGSITNLGEKYGKYIGMHAHNNQQLAFANTIEALSHGVSLLDATMMSMGRGAGNCAMELLLSFLKNPKYNVFPVLRFLEDYMLPLKETGAVWGYDIPYLLTGRLNQHPSAAIDFCKDNRKDYADFYTDLLDK